LSAHFLLEERLRSLLGRQPSPTLVEATRRWSEHSGHRLLIPEDDAYPALLREIADPPGLLHVIGRVELLSAHSLAVVGSRSASQQGRRNAQAFARTFSDAGLCIVSGLALGIDAAAHEGGLAGASSSIAVLGTGANIVYPPANAELAARLAKSGCIVTEYCLDTPPLPGNFPRRNRLISGLARGVLVIEASENSGSLCTAHLAADQNREVFAVPGSIHYTMSKGCHKLIKEGAKLVESAADVLTELGFAGAAQKPRARRSAKKSNPVLTAMGHDPVSVDELIQMTGLGPSECAAQLSLLEIEGRIEAIDGGRFVRLENPS
jgi:DNA processing protein